MSYKGGEILIAALNIQTRWRQLKYPKKDLSAYPLDMTNENSKDYQLYLEYKGLREPSDKTIEAFKNANIELPKLSNTKSSNNLFYDFVSSLYGN